MNCILCNAEGDCRHKRTDAAVLAHRANPTPETLAALLAVQGAATDEFFRGQADEFIDRTTRRNSLASLDEEFWDGAPSQAEAYRRLHGYDEPVTETD